MIGVIMETTVGAFIGTRPGTFGTQIEIETEIEIETVLLFIGISSTRRSHRSRITAGEETMTLLLRCGITETGGTARRDTDSLRQTPGWNRDRRKSNHPYSFLPDLLELAEHSRRISEHSAMRPFVLCA